MNNGVLRDRLIGEVVSKTTTWNPVRDAPNSEIKYIDLSAVDNVTKTVTGSQQLEGKDAPSRARQRVKAGDILVSTVRPNLNGVARVPDVLDNATASTGFCVLRPQTDKVNPSYLFHWVQSPIFIEDMARKATGASYPAVSDKIIFQSSIPLLQLEEQKRIATILDQADALRRLRQRSHVFLNDLSQSIFHEMFSANPNCKQSTLGQVAGLRRGPFGGALRKEIFVESGFKVYEQGNAINKSTQLGSYFIDRIKFNEMENFSLQENDLIVSCSGTLGRVYLIPAGAPAGIINQALLRVRAITSQVLPEFLEAFLESSAMQAVLNGFSRGTGLQNFPPMSEVRSIPVPLPSMEEQRSFVKHLREIAQQKTVILHSCNRQESLFSSLQHRAFRGEL